jgi:hypothetical protein
MLFLKKYGCDKGAAGALHPALSTFIFSQSSYFALHDKAAIQ